jgi:hypothetical protein
MKVMASSDSSILSLPRVITLVASLLVALASGTNYVRYTRIALSRPILTITCWAIGLLW